MYCPNCGKDNPAGAPNCHSCNAPLVGAMQPRRSSSSTIIIVFAVIGVVGLFLISILAAILFPVFARAREAARTSNCLNNMKNLSVALQLYSVDYDYALPQADKWCDLVQPYVKDPQAFVCPSVSELKCGYGLNSNVSSTKELQAPDTITLLFESDRDWNAHGGSEAMITQPRHGSFSVAFVDGHVRGIYQNEVSTLKWNSKQ